MGTSQSRSWRPLAFVLAGIVLGAGLVGPVAAKVGAGATPAAMQTRVASCQGLNFHPLESGTIYTFHTNMLYRTGPEHLGWFVCDPALPNKAVVTKVQFTVNDEWANEEVRNCGLLRDSLNPTLVGNEKTLAVVPATGVTAAPGTIRVTDTTINFATIDNAKYGYWLQCFLDPATGLWGASVTYKISAANG